MTSKDVMTVASSNDGSSLKQSEVAVEQFKVRSAKSRNELESILNSEGAKGYRPIFVTPPTGDLVWTVVLQLTKQ